MRSRARQCLRSVPSGSAPRKPEITGLPKWARSERFDIEATPEDPPDGPSKELESPRKKEMVRNLLRERFNSRSAPKSGTRRFTRLWPAGTVRSWSTGISGEFDFNLRYAPLKQSGESDLPSIFTACEQQLGLKLQPDRGAVRFWIVVRAEPPSPNQGDATHRKAVALPGQRIDAESSRGA